MIPAPENVPDVERLVNAPVDAVVEPIAKGDAKRLENPFPVTEPVAERVVAATLEGVVPPIATPFIVPPVNATAVDVTSAFDAHNAFHCAAEGTNPVTQFGVVCATIIPVKHKSNPASMQLSIFFIFTSRNCFASDEGANDTSKH